MSEIILADALPLAEDPQPFAEYLAAHGAELLPPTNQYEVLRYRMDDCGVVVIYKNGKGLITAMPPVAWHHYTDFKMNRAPRRQRAPTGRALAALRARLIERDGTCCCYCGLDLGCDITLEHWLSRRHGGNNSMANLSLAHDVCNRAADSLPIGLKLLVRDTLTKAASYLRPDERLTDEDVRALVGTIHTFKTESAPSC